MTTSGVWSVRANRSDTQWRPWSPSSTISWEDFRSLPGNWDRQDTERDQQLLKSLHQTSNQVFTVYSLQRMYLLSAFLPSLLWLHKMKLRERANKPWNCLNLSSFAFLRHLCFQYSFDLATKMSPGLDRRDIDVIMLCSTMRLPRLMIFVCKYSNICTISSSAAHKQHSILTNQTGVLDQCHLSSVSYALELHNPLNIRSWHRDRW